MQPTPVAYFVFPLWMVRLNASWQFRLRATCNRMPDLLPQRMQGSLDYHLGQHTVFYPEGGPMNGQTARLEVVRTLIIALHPALS